MAKNVLLTGTTGMDGIHLSELLINKGYKVYGIVRNRKTVNLNKEINLIEADLEDKESIKRAIDISCPEEIYNLAAMQIVAESWNCPEKTNNITGLGALRILDCIRDTSKKIKFFQASSGEIFKKTKNSFVDENSPIEPSTPYGIAKTYSHFITKTYRQAYGMFNCIGILFNHESEERRIEFVTRKITTGVAKIALNQKNFITLGNLDAKRDWGYAPDYVECMWLSMQQETPDDYIIASGELHSLKDFLQIAFKCVNIDNWQYYIKQDPKLVRPIDPEISYGDITKAKKVLNWQPKTSFDEMIRKMVENDVKILKRGLQCT